MLGTLNDFGKTRALEGLSPVPAFRGGSVHLTTAGYYLILHSPFLKTSKCLIT
jgi:hypothetical protein